MFIVQILVGTVALACVVVTVLPFVPSNEWWIRVWDFPRIHIGAASLAVAFLAMFLMRGPYLLVPLVLAVCAAFQAWKVLPYTPLVQPEIDLVPIAEDRTPVSLFAANVLMENRSHELLSRTIRTEQPDVVLLMETDQRWLDALSETLAMYPTQVALPLDNTYGMIFATRLETNDARILFPTDNETPAVMAEMKTPAGRPFRFVGLHPRPPRPDQDTDERDAQIRRAATVASDAGLPVISMGDFNDPSRSALMMGIPPATAAS